MSTEAAAPQTFGFEYEVRLAVALPRAWTTLLKETAAHHYDYKCREAGKQGVINGLHNTACDGEFPGGGFPVTWRDLDLITKVMEQAIARDRPLEAPGYRGELVHAIRVWLRATKDAITARHTAIRATYDAPAVLYACTTPLCGESGICEACRRHLVEKIDDRAVPADEPSPNFFADDTPRGR